jgi:di/tricarboxylate transporter
MHIDIFQGMSQWVLWLLSTALLCAAAFSFWRLGTKHSARDDGRLAAMTGVQGTALGLMTLIISFTFSAALSRYDNRKSLVLIEASHRHSGPARAFSASALPRPVRRTADQIYAGPVINERLSNAGVAKDRCVVARVAAQSLGQGGRGQCA